MGHGFDGCLGPIQYYLAKVDNAATAGTTGLQWFKVAQDGLSNGKWAVDTMITNDGWHYFTMPTCVAPGDYLMRVELLALHSASTPGQFPTHWLPSTRACAEST